MSQSIDPNAEAAYRRALDVRGRWVIVRRVGGDAPNTATFDAPVRAIVQGYVPEKAVGDISPEGAITQGARRVILLRGDLAAKHFPLPMQKNDKIVIADDVENPSPQSLAAGEVLDVMLVDPFKRALAGAVELMAVGV